MPLLHIALPSPRMPRRSTSARTSAAITAVLHTSAAIGLTWLALGPAASDLSHQAPRQTHERAQVPRMVFVRAPRPGGGGGGGGNRQPAPPSRAQNVGRDRITLPVARPVRAARDPADAPASQLVVLDAMPLVSGTAYLAGSPTASPSLAFSPGPGVGGSVGEGSGTGIGPGTGSGFGPGSGGGFGGGAYRPGNGVTAPTLRSQVRPNYTAEAMQRKIQGTVVLEMIVGPDGIPSDVRVVRSLDAYGLDVEAMRAAREWRFNPGRLGDTPVDVLVLVVIDFHIR